MRCFILLIVYLFNPFVFLIQAPSPNDIIEQNRRLIRHKFHKGDLGLRGDIKTIEFAKYKVIDNFGEISKGKEVSYSVGSGVFDTEGYLITSHVSSGKELRCVYDSSKKLISVDKYDDDKLVGRSKFSYDDEGRISTDMTYGENGNMEHIRRYNYPNPTTAIRSDSYVPGDTYERRTYIFDSNINVTNEIWESFQNEGFQVKENFVYDNFNRLINKKYYLLNGAEYHLHTETDYSYNENGDLSSKYFKHEDNDFRPSISTYKYEYDSNGNWFEMTEFKDDIPEHISSREIEYY